MSNDFSDIDQIALPVSGELGRAAYPPSRAGELTADVRTGEPFYAAKVGEDLVWSSAAKKPGQTLGQILIATEEGGLDVADLYPLLMYSAANNIRTTLAVVDSILKRI